MVPRYWSRTGVVDLFDAVCGLKSAVGVRFRASPLRFQLALGGNRRHTGERSFPATLQGCGPATGSTPEFMSPPMRTTNLVSPFVCSGADVSWPLHSSPCYVVTCQNGCGGNPDGALSVGSGRCVRSTSARSAGISASDPDRLTRMNGAERRRRHSPTRRRARRPPRQQRSDRPRRS
ncbi:MAG: hypothetical protein ACI9PP_001603 [Halobacteriales archaeon]|jgi:hypothetical protein